MHETLSKTVDAIRACGADWAVLTDPSAVTYATGHVVPIEAGPSPFAGGPTTAIIGRDGSSAIVAANVEGDAARASRVDLAELYEGFTVDTFPDRIGNYTKALTAICRRLGVGGKVAVQSPSFPRHAAELLGDCAFVSIDDELDRARSIKTPDEIAAKYRAGAAAVLSENDVEESFALLSRIETLPSIAPLMRLLAGG